ncbi:unnamed protein product, partial [Ixodes hexagonus]
TLRLNVDLPKYSGYADNKSVADFLAELRECQAASGISEEELLSRILPVALTGSAAAWRRRQPPFLTLQEFSERFEVEFLPPDYAARMLDELRARTQHRDESLVEYVRALQTLYDRADPSAPDSDKVSRAIRQSHPQFHFYLRGEYSGTWTIWPDQLQADILAELSYQPPPPPEACLEPSCAWAGNSQQASRRYREHATVGMDPEPMARPPRPRVQGLLSGRQSMTTASTTRCFRCGNLGHFRRDCTLRASSDNQGNEVSRR